MTTVISVENLSKYYNLGTIGTGTLSHDLNRWWARMCGKPDPLLKIGQQDHGNRNGEAIWALRDVSFEVKQGEVLGIIGRNGAGKSTLLKILSRVTAPTSGEVKVKGRIASLLEVGTGFHPELTGRENIFLNGAILGMSKREVSRKFDEIVAFAEVEKFIDTPVKRYSSGMYVRLAFAVAAHLEPEILLVDEVLAVGDAAFQKKCLGKMGDVAKEGRTVLFVSHSMGSVMSLSKKGMLLDQGKIKIFGDIDAVVDAYSGEATRDTFVEGRKVDTLAYIESVRFVGSRTIRSGQILTIEVCVFSNSLKALNISLDWRIKDSRGAPLIGGIPHVQFGQTNALAFGLNRFLIKIGPLPLAEGDYKLSFDVDLPWAEYLDRLEDCLEFSISSCVLGAAGQSFKNSWGHGSLIVPFQIDRSMGMRAEPNE
ncbi:MAG: ATP-binding cassette domain-containing protein [Chloroflexi bacterium]|nr:ATP-binding cassette domain-containing protein [Chloroflexota bacterium]